jgi:hypothetical protein
MANKGSFVKGEKRPNQGKRGADKTTLEVKNAIALVAQELGGTDRMVEWVREDPANERLFWGTIYPKLIPVQIAGSGKDGAFETVMKIELVAPILK